MVTCTSYCEGIIPPGPPGMVPMMGVPPMVPPVPFPRPPAQVISAPSINTTLPKGPDVVVPVYVGKIPPGIEDEFVKKLLEVLLFFIC